MATERDSGSKSTNRTTNSQSSATTLSPQAGATASGPLLHQLQKSIGNRATMQLFSQSRSQSAPIQMKAAQLDAIMGAHMREYTQDANGLITVDEKKEKGEKIRNKQAFEDLEVSDSTGKWGKIKVGGIDGFIRKDKIKAKKSDSDNESNVKDNIGDVSDMVTKGTGGKSDVLKDASDTLKDEIKTAKNEGRTSDVESMQEEKDKTDLQDAKIGVASSVFDTSAGIVGLINMAKNLNEKGFSGMEASDAVDVIENTQKTFTGVASMIDNSAKVSGKSDGIGDSEAVAGWAGSVGEGIAAIKSAFFAVKKIYELFKAGTDGDGKARGSLEVVSNGLESAQSAVKTVKAILEILDMGTGNLAKVIPGIGIAISGVKITIQVYDMIQAHMSKKKLDTLDPEFRERTNAIAEKKSILYVKASNGGDVKKLNDELTEIENEEKQLIEEQELAREMGYINQKRMNRGGITLGLEMLNMAGDIATLSGAGAAAGVSMKAVAGGAKVGMGVARRVKQYGRNKAAAAGPDSSWNSVFNADKSTDKKDAKRNKDVDVIFRMISKLPTYLATDEAVVNQYNRVNSYVEAAGCSTKELYAKNGNIEEQRKLLLEAMKKRD